jgi:hypothetical protein
MNASNTVINILILSLILFGVFLFLKNPFRIIKELLIMMKESYITVRIGLLPIWGPFYLVDRIFKLNIFNDNEIYVPAENDQPYPSEKTEVISFDHYMSYFLINTTEVEKILDSINEHSELFQIKDLNYKYALFEENMILKISGGDFLDTMYLVQWINQFENENNKPFIIAIFENIYDKEKSYFVVNDTTGSHINSLVGEDYLKNAFSIYLLNDYSKESYLSYNSEIEFNASLDLSQMISKINKIAFEQASA